jgi:hypothetical protein
MVCRAKFITDSRPASSSARDPFKRFVVFGTFCDFHGILVIVLVFIVLKKITVNVSQVD